MNEMEFAEPDDLYDEECEFCNYKNPINGLEGFSRSGKKDTIKLCNLCSSVLIEHGTYETEIILKAICFIGNTILTKLENK